VLFGAAGPNDPFGGGSFGGDPFGGGIASPPPQQRKSVVSAQP